MATGLKTDFVIYHEQFWGGAIETLQQNTEGFNAASLNTMRMVTRSLKGEYEKESFLKNTSSLVARRDPTSAASVASLKLTQGELVGVKLNRRLGPVEQSRDSFRKIGVDPSDFSYMLGQQAGVAIAVDYINCAINAVRAAIRTTAFGTGALQYDATGDTPATPTLTALTNGLKIFGDRAGRLVCFVMHSQPYFSLVKQNLSDKIVNVADVTVRQGTIETFGKPVVVIDSPNLVNLVAGSPTQTTYDILALVENAVTVSESEEKDVLSQPVTGLENIVDRIQGEYAFNLNVKGCAYDTGQGVNPNDTVVGTAATWVPVVADLKEMPGVIVKTK